MSLLASRAPRPALAEHPAFALMLLATLERFHCTMEEVREDYWLGRVWRALGTDPALRGRVARRGVTTILLTGPGYGPPPESPREMDRWRKRVGLRIEVDTGLPSQARELWIRWAEGPVEVRPNAVRSLIAQVALDDPRWGDLSPWAADLAPVVVPVALPVDAATPAVPRR